MDASEARAGLETFIKRKTGATAVDLSAMSRYSGGASRETWSFDARVHHADGRDEFIEGILRADPVKGAVTSVGRALEYSLIKAAWENGVVVPEPLWDGDEDIFGVKFFVMRRVPGEALGPRLVRAPQYAKTREVLPAQLAQSLARIHRIDYRRYPELSALPTPIPGTSPAQLELDTYETNLHIASQLPHPVFELALRWLRGRMPMVPEQVLVHGDFRLGNMMYDEQGLTGVIDWEQAHFGDPMEDFGYLMIRSWRFGGDKPVAGVGDREAFYEAYEAAGGFPVDRERVRYWEALSNLKWGIITVTQGFSYLDGRNPNVEHASIGRRPAETEIELISLLEGAQ
ncbi:MAG: phosphotransferase family protein [Chloroflexi bacterium]|nr:phosphotransferase family protein [Chloroflexota bacterium]